MTDHINRNASEKGEDIATATDAKKTFDMYHFISRWDLILLAALIFVLLLVVIYLSFSAGEGPGVTS